MTETAGVGVVGLGFGLKVHVPAYRLLAPLGVRVVALWGRDRARLEQAAQANGVPRAYTDWRQLVEDPDVDLVSVATPPAAHYEVALASLQAGKAVLCEKPLALNVAQAAELAAAAEAGGRPTAVNFSYRFVPAFQAARELLAQQAIGRVLRVEVDWRVESRLDATSPWTWKDSADEGGGALAAYGVHALDYVEWLAGPSERALGQLETSSGRRRTRTGEERAVTSDDACTVSLELADGAQATLAISMVASEARVHRIEVRGERGRVVLENSHPTDPVRHFRLGLQRGEGPVEEIAVAPPEYRVSPDEDGRIEPMAAHASALVRAILAGSRSDPSFVDGLRTQRLLDAIRRSAAAGGWVELGD